MNKDIINKILLIVGIVVTVIGALPPRSLINGIILAVGIIIIMTSQREIKKEGIIEQIVRIIIKSLGAIILAGGMLTIAGLTETQPASENSIGMMLIIGAGLLALGFNLKTKEEAEKEKEKNKKK